MIILTNSLDSKCMIEMLDKRGSMFANPTHYTSPWGESEPNNFETVLNFFQNANATNQHKLEVSDVTAPQAPAVLAWSRIK